MPATPETKTRTTGVICPVCMNEEATVRLDLCDLNLCECSECGSEFSPDEAALKFAAMADRWRAVSDWIKDAPLAV